MTNFDEILDRRSTDSIKWNLYPAEVLPAWVADMDFRSPEPVIRALRERVDHGVFGYAGPQPELPKLLVERMARLYGWEIRAEDIVFLPGVVTGFVVAAKAYAGVGQGVVLQTPVYHPFFYIKRALGTIQQESELVRQPDGSYAIDWNAFECSFEPSSRMFLLCNPHNPVGRVFCKEELERMAEICLRRGVTICSDEIHADFIYPGHRHIPIASINPEISQHTITLMAPSKTFNIAGLECAFAIVQNPDMRRQLQEAMYGLVHGSNMIGYLAATAAFREGQPWLDDLLAYLTVNRDTLVDFVNTQLPGVRMASPEGTYLGWLDCREAGIGEKPGEWFLEKARVALNEGGMFGKGGQGFVRFNYGTPRALLLDALQRMKQALAEK